jgi:hypothetical protein
MQSAVYVFGIGFASQADAIGYIGLALLGLLAGCIMLLGIFLNYHSGPEAEQRKRHKHNVRMHNVAMRNRRQRTRDMLSGMRY